MGLDCLSVPEIKHLWDDASLNTGIDFVKAVQDEEMLSKTKTVQPLILLVQESLRRLLKRTPNATAGQSLGEYNALIAAGVLTFDEAIKLVIKRGNAMDQALTEKTIMKAALGDLSGLDELLKIDGLYLSNLNSPSQAVIGGSEKAFESVTELPLGIKRLILLKTEGAFHTPYMKNALTPFETALRDVTFKNPLIDLYQNVSGQKESSITKESLLDHLIKPVQFYPIIKAMIEDGIKTFIEIGPSSVLSKTIQQINPDVTVHAATDLASIHAISF
jgi:[acyl-carrier-protein] S-malonyltransferase